MTPEHSIQNEIRLALGRDAKLFRNNCGVGWTGQVTRLPDGAVLIRKPRPLHSGLMVGSGDLIGWRTITITPEMVGQKIAVFCSVEVKAPNGRTSKEQLNWHNRVIADGGLSVIAKSSTDAKKGLALCVNSVHKSAQAAGAE